MIIAALLAFGALLLAWLLAPTDARAAGMAAVRPSPGTTTADSAGGLAEAA